MEPAVVEAGEAEAAGLATAGAGAGGGAGAAAGTGAVVALELQNPTKGGERTEEQATAQAHSCGSHCHSP